MQVVDLVRPEAGSAAAEGGGVLTVERGVLDGSVTGGALRPDVEESKATFELLVVLRGCLDDAWVVAHERLLAGPLDDGGGARDARPGCGQPIPLPKTLAARIALRKAISSSPMVRASSASRGRS